VPAEREVAQAQRAESDALEPQDRVPDRVEHAPDLPLAALVQHELDAVGREPPRARGGGHAVLQRHALAQPAQCRLPHRRVAHLRAVDARHLERRVREPVRELAVVGEQEQPGRVRVQAADRVEPLAAAHERDDRRAPLRVLRGADVAGRLVERIDHVAALEGDPGAVDRDRVLLPHVACRVAHDLATDGHAAGEHELLGGAAGGDAGMSQVFGEAHGAATIGGVDLGLLHDTLADLGEPAFRARQVWRWTATGAPGYDAMTDLPADLRGQLAERVPFSTLVLADEAHARDGTVKALFRTADGRPVEAVLMRYRDGRRSVCVSSQSGCPLTCTFCATGTMKFGRNLTTSEILDQVLHFRRIEPVDHLVFMGMGEPMLALDAVLGACERLPDVGITNRRTTISTVGWVPGIRRLTESDLPVRLAFSLHAPEDALRSRIMPINDRYPIAEVLAACNAYHERRRRQVFIEYVMLDGVNDTYEQALALTRLLDPRIYKVNLIPYNPTGMYGGSSRGAIDAFKAVLEEHGLRATVRLTRGRDIAAACGQLAAATS